MLISDELFREVLTSIKNAWNTFPDLLFSNNPEVAMVAWTLLATITIPIVIFIYSWRDGKRSSSIQKLQLEALEEAREANKTSALVAQRSYEQSFVEGLGSPLDYESSERYFTEVSSWEDSPLKSLGIRRLRMQTSVSLPGNTNSIENPESLTYEGWKDYKESFNKRFEENPVEFIKELGNFLSRYGGDVSDSEYNDIAQLIFGKKLKFDSSDGYEPIKYLFRHVPRMTEGSLEYSLNWPSDEKLNNIDLVVSSLSKLLKYDAFPRDKYSKIRSSMAQPIADFLNTQDFRNISDLGFDDSEKTLKTAVKIVYLAGESAKIHGGKGEVDHLKMRMIEGIPELFKNIDFSKIVSLNYVDKIVTKEFWSDGCRLLKEDEPQVWGRMWPEIRIFDDNIKSL